MKMFNEGHCEGLLHLLARMMDYHLFQRGILQCIFPLGGDCGSDEYMDLVLVMEYLAVWGNPAHQTMAVSKICQLQEGMEFLYKIRLGQWLGIHSEMFRGSTSVSLYSPIMSDGAFEIQEEWILDVNNIIFSHFLEKLPFLKYLTLQMRFPIEEIKLRGSGFRV